MGKRGPRPTPSAVLEARGSDEVQRRKSHGAVIAVGQEADASPVLPGVPGIDDARMVVCAAINAANTGMKGGEIAQEILARAIVEQCQSRQRLDDYRLMHPAMDMDEDTIKAEKALAGILHNAEVRLMKTLVEHGLTPASISEIRRPDPKKIKQDGPQKAPLTRGT